MSKEEQILDELSKMPPMVIATAYLYAINYTLYGVDVTKEWLTAIQNVSALEKAYNKGYYEGLKNQAERYKDCFQPKNDEKPNSSQQDYNEEVAKWIPISERLPEENKTVIASTKYGVYPETKYTKEYGWEWAYEAGADYWRELEDVIAWMPLPKPYEPQESEV